MIGSIILESFFISHTPETKLYDSTLDKTIKDRVI